VAIEKSQGLILRVIPFRDTSKVVTVYSAERGAVSLLAKGVRGPKPRFGAALEIFALSDLVFYHRDSRDLQLLAEATLLEAHLGLCRDPLRYAYGGAVLEFLLRVLRGPEAPGRLYDLSLRALEVLESCPGAALAPVFRAFELKAVSFLGHRPELYRCVECGREATGEPEGFSPRLGGLICAACEEHVQDAQPLRPPAWGLFRRLLTSTLATLESDPPSTGETAALGRVLESFFFAHLERYEPLRALRLADALVAARRS
jgi:DNA repair protein RecO (recombination protein O)